MKTLRSERKEELRSKHHLFYPRIHLTLFLINPFVLSELIPQEKELTLVGRVLK